MREICYNWESFNEKRCELNLLWMLFACGPQIDNVADFEAEYALSQCHAYRQCYRMMYDGQYDGMNDCEDKVERTFHEENLELFSECTFNTVAAIECVSDINTSTCGELWTNNAEIYAACHEDVWQCQ